MFLIFIFPAALYYNRSVFAIICVILLIFPYITLLNVTMKGKIKFYLF